MWTCPKCNRQFRNTNQDHSCQVTDPESHFLHKQPGVFATFEKLQHEVLKFEGARIISVKNAILFQAKSNFLAVKPKKAILDIEFILDAPADVFPVHKTVRISKSKWAHFVRLESPDEVDDQLKNWIFESYLIAKK